MLFGAVEHNVAFCTRARMIHSEPPVVAAIAYAAALRDGTRTRAARPRGWIGCRSFRRRRGDLPLRAV